jgi:membrane peptidoglycan carboxypeptidase
MRFALGNSINIPAIKVLSKIGVPTMIDLARKMGITTWKDSGNYGLAITLGGGDVKMTDMTTVYGVFANGGYRVDLNPILNLTDSQGNTLEEKKDSQDTKKQVLDPGVSFIISDILSDNRAREMEFGSNSPLNIPNYNVSVKTGTSDNKRDNWTIGYTSNRLVTVWVGNNDNTPMSPTLASGITGAAPIWNKIMTNILTTTPEEPLTPPSNVIQKPCLGRLEYFVKGTENSVNCTPLPSPSVSPSPNP